MQRCKLFLLGLALMSTPLCLQARELSYRYTGQCQEVFQVIALKDAFLRAGGANEAIAKQRALVLRILPEVARVNISSGSKRNASA